MNHLHSVCLTNIVYFKGASTLRFLPGTTLILGRNRQRRGAHASNGSGKSLLIGTVANVLFDSHPVVLKNARSVQKQIYSKDSSVTLRFKTAQHRYEYIKSGAHTSISQDGRDLKSRVARDQLRGLIDLSEEEFYSTVYLDSRRTNAFQMGTSSERFAFLTQLFRLQDLDDFRKHVQQMTTSLSAKMTSLEEARQQLELSRQELASIPADIVQRAQRLSHWLQRSSLEVQRNTALKHEWDNRIKYTRALKAVNALPATRELKDIKRDQDALALYNAALGERHQAVLRARQQEKELKELAIDDSRYDAWLKATHRLVPVEKPHQPPYRFDPKAKARLPGRAVCEADYAQSTLLHRQAKAQWKKFKDEVQHQSQCSLCHSVLDAGAKKRTMTGFLRAVSTHVERAMKARVALDEHDKHDEWVVYLMALKKYEDYASRKARLDAYDHDAALKYRRIKASPVRIPSKPVNPELDAQSLEQEHKTAQERAVQVRLVQELKVPRPASRAVDTEELNAKVVQRMRSLSGVQEQSVSYKMITGRIQELTERINTLEAETQDIPVYRMLGEAYSTKGIKLLLVQRIAAALEHNLNRHAGQIFAENFRFEFNIVEGRFDCTVVRTQGTKEIRSDIRLLSGAESRLFVFLFVLALLPLIPDRRRMNVLFLDEPEVGMDQDTFETFYSRLLPALQKIVPCIVLATPRHDYELPEARVLTVLKENGCSSIVEGVVL